MGVGDLVGKADLRAMLDDVERACIFLSVLYWQAYRFLSLSGFEYFDRNGNEKKKERKKKNGEFFFLCFC